MNTFAQIGSDAIPTSWVLLVSTALFSVGLAGALTRKNAILVLIGIELMLNAANLNLIAFWKMGVGGDDPAGPIFVLFAIAVAAAEAAVGLGIIISIHRHFKTCQLDEIEMATE